MDMLVTLTTQWPDKPTYTNKNAKINDKIFKKNFDMRNKNFTMQSKEKKQHLNNTDIYNCIRSKQITEANSTNIAYSRSVCVKLNLLSSSLKLKCPIKSSSSVESAETFHKSLRKADQWLQQRNVLSTLLKLCILVFVFDLMPVRSEAFDLGNELNLKPTKYTEFEKNITYLSSMQYNARGMQPLYNITHKIMWFFIGEDALPDGK